MAQARRILFQKHFGRSTLANEKWRRKEGVAYKVLVSHGRKYLREKRPQLFTLSFDWNSHVIDIEGTKDQLFLDAFFELFRRYSSEFLNGIALDVGANYGTHSIYYSNYFGKVHAFEPNRLVFDCLELNTRKHGNITCHNWGASESGGVAYIDVPDGHTGAAKVTNAPVGRANQIELRRLDQMDDPGGRVMLMKVDVEGHECSTLKGAAGIIRKDMPIVLFEQAASEIVNGTSETISYLTELGYQRFATQYDSHSLPQGNLRGDVHLALSTLRRLFTKRTYSIELVDRFESRYHSQIIAIPDWASLG